MASGMGIYEMIEKFKSEIDSVGRMLLRVFDAGYDLGYEEGYERCKSEIKYEGD